MNPFALLLSFLPSAAVYAVGGFILLLGAGGVVYSLFPLVPYRRIASVAGASLIGLACWFGGVAAEQSVSEAAALRQQLADTNARIITMQMQADALQRDSIKAASQAAGLATFQGKSDALTARTTDGACLPADTADGLRSLWGAQ